jgi:nicotinate-nucleotide--dimethylbenzimidazole phosphoribosyltransferase
MSDGADAPPAARGPGAQGAGMIEVAECVERFSDEARRAVYEVIALRRDVRHFRADEDVDDATLGRILGAAHLAPSVGFSQPWGFLVLRDRERRARIRESFLRCREAEAARFPPGRREQYLAHRLEAILEAPANVCVAVDLRPREEAILGTTVQPDSVRASACCAVQNLWLAARAEGVGVGWVSIVEASVLREELALPPGVEPVAYLCVGRARAFRARPMLEETGWLPRRPVAEAIHAEVWRDRQPVENPPAGRGAQGDALRSSWSSAAPSSLDFDAGAEAAARAHQDRLTKPPGSLGRLEAIATWYAGVVGRFPCAPPERAAIGLFAADHGVVREAISAYPSQTTAAMVRVVMSGGAAINVLARRYRVDLALVDVGVAGDLSAPPERPEVALSSRKVRAGTGNLLREAAMTRAEVEAAMAVGEETADACIARGAEIVGTGEVGIGNTTSAAAIACALTGLAPDDVVGHGAGIDASTRARKVAVVREALRRHAPSPSDPVGVLAAVGGLELAAGVGFLLRATARRVPVVLDGFLASACALSARAFRPEIARWLLASHASAERGSALLLEALGLEPLLSLGMRLGEGTAAVLAIDLVRTAVSLQAEMATFATAGVPRSPR